MLVQKEEEEENSTRNLTLNRFLAAKPLPRFMTLFSKTFITGNNWPGRTLTVEQLRLHATHSHVHGLNLPPHAVR